MRPSILIIGASGFIGSNLLREFENEEIPVKAMSRNPEKIYSNAATTVKIAGDLEDPESLKEALKGVRTVYYLAHSLDYGGSQFMQREKAQARNLNELLTENHKVIYLGGIASTKNLSPHLKSRQSVGEVFLEGPAKTVEFQASLVIGRGSASFEIIRGLVHRLPFIFTTSWSKALSQPIAVKDVVDYLMMVRSKRFKDKNNVFEIGGADRLPYEELMIAYAREKNLFRPKVHLPFLPKAAAAEILKIVVPEFAQTGEKLLESIECHSTADNSLALKTFNIQPLGYAQAIELAQDPDLDDMELKEVFQKLKGHPKIPSYFAGQTLQASFRFKNARRFEEAAKGLSSVLPLLKQSGENEFKAKLPFAGEIKAALSEGYVIVAYRPKYFFQSAGWTMFQKFVEEIQRHRS